MKHFGDITKLSGYTLPIVDVITGGSPCQDLSVAGKRVGLAGERSGLFMEQMRIVKEMRELDRQSGRAAWAIRPRYMVWENVPGAFSSNGGRDFQAVLTEIVRIAEPEAPDVPMPDKGGWSKSGCLYDGEMGNWSVAWRVHDAQYWGVPQRRKRICVLADFGGLTAPEILFDPQFERTTESGEPVSLAGHSGAERRPEVQTQPESLSGDSAESGTDRKRTAVSSGCRSETAINGCLNGYECQSKRIYDPRGIAPTLASGTTEGKNIVPSVIKAVCYGISAFDSNAMKSGNPHSGIYEADTARTLDLNGGSPACNQGGMAVVCLNDQGGQNMDISEGVTGTLRAQDHGHPPLVMTIDPRQQSIAIPINTMVGTRDSAEMRTCLGIGEPGDPQFTISAAHCHAVCVGNGQLQNISMATIANTLDTMHDQQAVLIVYAPDTAHALHAKANLQFREDSETYIVGAIDCRNGTINPDTNGTLQAKEQGINLNSNNVVLIWPEVRRLMPIECERLQGYPDGWTDIGEWTDSNGKKHKEADSPRYKALGNSIAIPFWQFLARRICAQYERPVTLGSLFDGIGGFPLAFSRCGAIPVWASEIEEFPIAVTKMHFPEAE